MHLVLTETAARVPDCYAREMGKTPLCPTRTPRSWRTSSSAADQAAIDEALFADMPEGSLLSEGPGASTQELEKDLAIDGGRHETASRRRGRRRRRRAHGSVTVRGRPRGDRGADGTPWEKIADHYRMTSLL